jgi:hypothetical protein
MESITIPARTVTARLGQARIVFGDDGNDEVFVHRNVTMQVNGEQRTVQESETDCAKGTDDDLCAAITAVGGSVTPEQLRAAFVSFGGRRAPEEATGMAAQTMERRATRKANEKKNRDAAEAEKE